MQKTDHHYIQLVNQLAEQTAALGFDPFAAILVQKDEVVATSMDKCIDYSDPTAHAELILISEYCRKQKLISLEGYSMYCNVEPCMMCAGAIHWSRLSKVVYSVSQEQLKGVSKGNTKPNCQALIQQLGNKVEVIGPINSEQGMTVLNKYPFLSKKERHKKFYKK